MKKSPGKKCRSYRRLITYLLNKLSWKLEKSNKKLSIHCVQTTTIPPIPTPNPACSCHSGHTSLPTKVSPQPLTKEAFMSIVKQSEEERARERNQEKETLKNERVKDLENFEREQKEMLENLRNRLKLPP